MVDPVKMTRICVKDIRILADLVLYVQLDHVTDNDGQLATVRLKL